MITFHDINVSHPPGIFLVSVMAEQVTESIEELKRLLVAVNAEKVSGGVTVQSRRLVQKSLIKLRRSHAKMREIQMNEQRQVISLARKIQEAKLALDNSAFMETQCNFIVEKFNSAQCPELDKISASLPSPDEYTAKHRNDPDFVAYDSNPHQFMLSMLASELEERRELERKVEELKQEESVVKNDIAKKQKFLASLSSKLSDMNKSVEGILQVFSYNQTEKRFRPDRFEAIRNQQEMYIIASKFDSLLDTGVLVQIEDNQSSLKIEIRPSQGMNTPPETSGIVVVNFSLSGIKCSDDAVTNNIDWVNCNAFSTVQQIRYGRVGSLWRDYEGNSLVKNCQQTLPIVTSAVFEGLAESWLSEGESVSSGAISKLRRSTSTMFEATIKNHSVLVDMEKRRIKISLGNTVSSIDSSDDSGMIVDIRLAQIESVVNKWWKVKVSEFGEKAVVVPGELSAVLVKIVVMINKL
jgi:hypothetical protein